MEAEIGAVNGANPNHGNDGRRNSNDQSWEGKNQSGERIHSAEEHVVAPNHVAEEANGDQAAVDDLDAEQRLAHGGHQDVRDDAYGGNNSDVNLGMSEKPEEIVPEQGRAAGMRLQMIADHQTSGNEKASACDTIKDQEHASRKKNCKGQKADARCDEPGPRAYRKPREHHAFGAQVKRSSDEIQ